MTRTGTGRRGIWIDATIHAREWLSTTTHLKIMQRVCYTAFSVFSNTVQHRGRLLLSDIVQIANLSDTQDHF